MVQGGESRWLKKTDSQRVLVIYIMTLNDSSGNPCYDEDLGSFPRSQLQKKFLSSHVDCYIHLLLRVREA